MTWLPELPAFPGLRPPDLVWKPFDNALSESALVWALFDLLESRQNIKIDQAWQLETHHPNPYGFFRLQGRTLNDNDFDWFIKLVQPQKANRMVEGQRIADQLICESFCIPPLLDGFPLTLSDDVIALAFPFWEGRFTDYEVTDMKRLGRSIGQLHRQLKSLPQAEYIRESAEKRHDMLVIRWQELLQAPEKMARLLPEVQTCLKQHSPDWLAHLMEDAQPVHGDLNVGNVLFLLNNQIAFLDFEDSLTAWFDPLKDLAFVIERFVLCVHEPIHLTQISHALLDAYMSENPITIRSDRRLIDLLQGLAIRSLLILTELQLFGEQKIPKSEWQKFVFLYNLTLRYETELKTIAAPYVNS